MSGNETPPWENLQRLDGADRVAEKEPTLLVDLRRCIGCHSCSVACKTEHSVPLGTFRMRVRWLPRPDGAKIAFLPLFDADLCDFGSNRRSYGMQPACVDACPTEALLFADLSEGDSRVAGAMRAHRATRLDAPAANLKDGVVYIGAEEWHAKAIHKGCALDERDEDIIYEQR